MYTPEGSSGKCGDLLSSESCCALGVLVRLLAEYCNLANLGSLDTWKVLFRWFT